MGTLAWNAFGGLGDPFGAGGVRRLFESPISLEPSWTEGWLVFPRGPKGEGCQNIFNELDKDGSGGLDKSLCPRLHMLVA